MAECEPVKMTRVDEEAFVAELRCRDALQVNRIIDVIFASVNHTQE